MASTSLVLKEYEDEFFEVVNAKFKLQKLKRKKVINSDIISEIERRDGANAQEILFAHLQRNADIDTLREYCKVIIAADGFPKMQKLGKKMLQELPPEAIKPYVCIARQETDMYPEIVDAYHACRPDTDSSVEPAKHLLPTSEQDLEPLPLYTDEQLPPPFILPDLPSPAAMSDSSNEPENEPAPYVLPPLPAATDWLVPEPVDDEMGSYHMTSNPRGLAIIISNTIRKMKKCEGTDLDTDQLFQLFQNLCYDVRLFENLPSKEMLSKLQQFAKQDHRNRDSMVICILTHGMEGQLYGTDEEIISMDHIFKPFNGCNCPTLDGKPKVFLLQACCCEALDNRVNATDSLDKPFLVDMKAPAIEMDQIQQKAFETMERKAVVLPAEADFAVVFATVPGYVSWRNSAYGSWFIKAFVEVMTENLHKRHFLEILTLVSNKVALEFQSPGGSKQILDYSIQLRKHLYFNPPGSWFLAGNVATAYKPGVDVPVEMDPPYTIHQQLTQPGKNKHTPTPEQEEPLPFALPPLPVIVSDPDIPNWSVLEFTDTSYKPAVPFVLSPLPVIVVSDPDNPNWSVPECTDTSCNPAEVLDDGLESYRMTSNPRGLAVIISNKTFIGKMENRMGTDLDAENLYRLFEGLGYDVKLFTDLTGKKILSTLQHVAKLDHQSMDSLVVCILTHGVEGQLYGTDGELIPIGMVFMSFNGYNCPTLVGKPKVFLLDACRGGVFDHGVGAPNTQFDKKDQQEPSLDATDYAYYRCKEERAANYQQKPSLKEQLKILEMTAAERVYPKQQEEYEARDKQPVVLPIEADFAVVFATVPGYVSWRNSAFGSWFIKAFVGVMTESVHKRHFLEILTLVNNKVALEFQSRDGGKQITECCFRLRKFLYFNPLIMAD